MQVSPCKGCEEREEYGKCHDRCIAYKKWYNEQLAEKEKLKADKKAGISMEARIRRQLWK